MRFLTATLLIILIFFPAVSQTIDFDIMNTDVPIIYGEEGFIQRITEKTGGVRQPLGLVLSGGSARAFAHIGVLKYLEEQEIVPDFIVTNSMGSIVGLLYAAGLSPGQIEKAVGDVNLAGLFLPAYPLHGGIIEPALMSNLLYRVFGELDLSELEIPFMLLCEDLITKRQIRLCEGDFYELLEASYALPFYFPPIEFREHILMDGGVSNILPLAPAYDYTNQVILSTAFYDNPDLKLRNPITILNVAIDVGKTRTGIEDIKEFNPLLIRCNVESFSFMEFDAVQELLAAGYESAEKMKDEISTIGKNPPGEGLLNRRVIVNQAMEETIRNYQYQNTIFIKHPFFVITPGVGMNDYPEDPIYLLDDLFLYAAGTLRTGGLKTSLAVGGIWDLYDSNTWTMGTQLTVKQNINNRLSAGANWRLALEPEEGREMVKGSYISGNILFTPAADRFLQLDLSTVMEISSPVIETVEESLFTGQFSLSLNGGNEGNEENAKLPSSDLDAGIQLKNLENGAIFSNLKLYLPLSKSFRIKERVFTRVPLWGSTEVDSFRRDYFRGGVEGEFKTLVFNSIQLDFTPKDFSPTFAEVIIWKKLTFSAYADTGWFDGFEWGVGLETIAIMSLIGLKSFQISGYAGWQGSARSLSGGLFLNMAM
ncbi:MAG: patatin-like phospholipase family protein [Spirochaetales bacterium]|nr:patatin-like phospholipase family protein [Spirochaetales bacterium]